MLSYTPAVTAGVETVAQRRSARDRLYYSRVCEVSTVRRSNRQGVSRKQRGGARVQKRLGEQPEGGTSQGDQEASREGERSYLYLVDENPIAEVYGGQLDDTLEAWRAARLIPQRAKPPKGCAWDVSRDETSVTLRAVKDGETVVELSGDYCNAKTGEWRDPKEVSERLAQVILFGSVLEGINNNKTKT